MIILEWHEFSSLNEGCVLVRGAVESSSAGLDGHLQTLLHKAIAGEVLKFSEEERAYCRIRLINGKPALVRDDATLMDRFDQRLALVARAWGRLTGLQQEFRELGFRGLHLSVSARALLATRSCWSEFYVDEADGY